VRSAEFWSANLPDLARKPQALRQWLGQVVVVNFWAPWCPPCREEIPGFIRLQDRLGARGLQFVGVALDEADKVQAYVDETGINYPILLGGMEAVKLGQAAGNRLGGLPYTVVFDRQGHAVASLVGGVTETRLEGIVQPLL
jgi:thiol-disulfide isomerase/thioredoxin